MQNHQNIVLCAIGYFILSHTVWGGDIDEVLPLPQWSGAEIQYLQDGGGAQRVSPLFPDGLMTRNAHDLNPHSPAQPRSIATESPASSPDIDLSLFLPDALLGKTIGAYQQQNPIPNALLRSLDDDFLTFCRESPRDEHLIDPDSHVSETQKEDLLRFLQFHARDARIKAYVIVMDRDQIVPKKADLSNVASGAVSVHDSCLAVYPLGEPWRARLFLSAPIHRVASPDYLNSVVEDCAKDAALVTDPLEQLHRFTVRLSIRLFWLEKMIGSSQSPLIPAAREKIPSELIANREAALTAALLEDAAPPVRSFVQWWSVVLGVMFSLAGGGATFAALRYRRQRLLNYVWILPEIEIPPRLGGAFSGGGGAWIQYR